MSKSKSKTVNLTKKLKDAIFDDEDTEDVENQKEETDTLGAYILMTSFASIGGGLVFWAIILRLLQMIQVLKEGEYQMDSREYVNSTVEKNKNIIMILVLIATACAGFISCVNDKTINFLIILMFTVCVIGILSLLLITQVLKRYLAVTAK